MNTSLVTPERDLLRKIASEVEAQEIIVSKDPKVYFSMLEKHFPLNGSKIAWSKVPGSYQEEINYDDYEKSIVNFFDSAMNALRWDASNEVIVVGDSAMEVALSATVEVMRRYILDIVDLPQHTYIISPDVSWCLSYTMEGDMAYGHNPTK